MASLKKSLPENLSLNIDSQKEFHKKVKELEKEVPHQTGPGVVFIKHLPHGFFEPQMKAYFSQFGKIKRLRVSRSKKSGRIKGYGYIEFAVDAVAKIVASTMNNYLMFNRLIKCSYVPQNEVHEDTFKGCNRKFSKPKAHALSRQRHNTVKTPEQMAKAQTRARSKQKKSLAKLAELGIEYELPGMVTKEEIQSIITAPSTEDTKPDVEAAKPAAKKASAQKAPERKKRKTETDEDIQLEVMQSGEHSESEDGDSDVENDNSDDSDSEEEFDFDTMFGTSQSQIEKPGAKSAPVRKKAASIVKKNTAPAKKDSKKQSPQARSRKQGGKRGGRVGNRR